MDCDFCNKKIDGIPFKCKHCHKSFCSAHRLPEDHECEFALKNYSQKSKKYFEEVIKDVKEEKKRQNRKKKAREKYYKKKYGIQEDSVPLEVDATRTIILILIVALALFLYFYFR